MKSQMLKAMYQNRDDKAGTLRKHYLNEKLLNWNLWTYLSSLLVYALLFALELAQAETGISG